MIEQEIPRNFTDDLGVVWTVECDYSTDLGATFIATNEEGNTVEGKGHFESDLVEAIDLWRIPEEERRY